MTESRTRTSSRRGAWNPRILVFCCESVGDTDNRLERTIRTQTIADPRILYIPCSGNVDPALCVQLLREGMDGVLVLGCHPGECRCSDGNRFAKMKISWARRVLRRTELGDDRLHIDWVSSLEVKRFIRIISDFMETLGSLGPNPVNDPDRVSMREQLDAAVLALNDLRVRALMDKARMMPEQGNVYGEAIDRDELEATVGSALDSEYLRKSILVMLKVMDMTVPQLAHRLGLSPDIILRQVVRLRQRNLMEISRIDGSDPAYRINRGGICGD